MAAAQPVQSRVGDGDIADWMAQRWRDVAKLGPEAEAAGRRLWAQTIGSGQDLAASTPAQVRALGAQSLGNAAQTNSSPGGTALPSSPRPTDRSGFVPSADAPTLQALRQKQARFGQVQHDLSIQNIPYALPAPLPAGLLGLEVPGALGFRGLLSAPSAGALAYPEMEAWQVGPAQEASAGAGSEKTSGDFAYAAGRSRLAQANGISARVMNADVHHSLPVQYSENFPNADPNRLANLWSLRPQAHQIATRLWARFAKDLAGRTPTQAEIMAQKLKVDGEVAPYIRRAGVPRSNIPRKKGGLY